MHNHQSPVSLLDSQTGVARERLWLTIALALLLVLYLSSSYGVVGSNDGSHFAACRALVERGTFQIADGVLFAIEDVAVHDGRRYSNKPPGTALLAVPLYRESGF